MKLTEEEKSILKGEKGEIMAEALDYVVQFGEAFDAEKLVDISYCHYPAEMGIYKGNVEEAVEYAKRGGKVSVLTTSTTLCTDIEKPEVTGIPKPLADLQKQIEQAHRSMGILETYTCTPQQLGFIPPFGSYAAMTESSAIIYYNSVFGVRTNRGGILTRYSAICGKYPLMGYLIDENRKGTHHFIVDIPEEKMNTHDAWSALGFHIGKIVGDAVPVIDGIKTSNQEFLISFGATLATSGSVTLYHIVGVTPEARTLEEAFQNKIPKENFRVTESDLKEVYEQLNNIPKGAPIDFVMLGCPHFNLRQLQELAEKLKGKKIAKGVRFWVCTNRMTKKQAEFSGYLKTIEDAGCVVTADACPVESHLRQATCREYGLEIPNVKAMVCNSAKMLRYVGDLIGCKVAFANIDNCIESAIKGVYC